MFLPEIKKWRDKRLMIGMCRGSHSEGERREIPVTQTREHMALYKKKIMTQMCHMNL